MKTSKKNTRMQDGKKHKKIVLTGPPGGGKSSILACLNGHELKRYESTIGIDFGIYVTKNQQKIHVWDTAGSERFWSIIKTYYRGADAVWFVFDLSDSSSVTQIEHFINLFKEIVSANQQTKCYLVGNKNDLSVTKSTKQKIETISKNNFFEDYFVISAFNFETVTKKIEQCAGFERKIILNEPEKENKKSCTVF
jgi:small GTP-binding protein